MEEPKNCREVENRLRARCAKTAPVRSSSGTISKFGLMEMSRQRLEACAERRLLHPLPTLRRLPHPRHGIVGSAEILRIIPGRVHEATTRPPCTARCQWKWPRSLLNEKRTEIAKIELKQRLWAMLMAPNKTLETPNYSSSA